MIDGLELYGGFKSDANSLSERDYVKYKTYLSGNIDVGGDLDSFIVVNTEPDSEISSDTVLDGFIITHSTEAGIYCNEADLVVRNCVLTDNDANGINIYKSNPYIFDSVITDNAAVGVYDCNESLVTIEGCIISQNGANGISCRKNATMILKNSWIYNNGGEGIALTDAASGTTIRNNTIVYNTGKGIFAETGYAPTVKNCIVWGNENGDISGCSATYSCFDGGTGSNIDDDPNFVCLDPSMYNYHLRYGSPVVIQGMAITLMSSISTESRENTAQRSTWEQMKFTARMKIWMMLMFIVF
jgi:parallel beta-helix repeat protein